MDAYLHLVPRYLIEMLQQNSIPRRIHLCAPGPPGSAWALYCHALHPAQGSVSAQGLLLLFVVGFTQPRSESWGDARRAPVCITAES